MKPTEVWLVLDQYNDFFLVLGGKPGKERWGHEMFYSYTHIEEGLTKVYVASNSSQENLRSGIGKGMRKNTCRRIA